jgi:hypothetical protein
MLGISNERAGHFTGHTSKRFYLGIEKYIIEKCKIIDYTSKEFINNIHTLTLSDPSLILKNIQTLIERNHTNPVYVSKFLRRLIQFINNYIEIKFKYTSNTELDALLGYLYTLVDESSIDPDGIYLDMAKDDTGKKLKRY